VEFPNALRCGTHAGCRTHDACYDTAVANGETYRYNQRNQDAVLRWGLGNTQAWARGGGPYDDWWYFVDDPVVRRSWRVSVTPPPPAAGRQPSSGP